MNADALPIHAKVIENVYLELKKFSLNHFVACGCLAVASTEGGFSPRSEMSYRATPEDRLREIFGKRLSKYDNEALSILKKDDLQFFEVIYGGRYGNTSYGDGFRYRGRGMNQITFKNIYDKIGRMIGVDLVTAPDRLNEVEIAGQALAAYFFDSLRSGKSSGELKKKFLMDDYATIDNLTAGVMVAFQCNCGWGTKIKGNTVLEAEQTKQFANVLVINQIVKAV